jgi:hypothetical protein
MEITTRKRTMGKIVTRSQTSETETITKQTDKMQ